MKVRVAERLCLDATFGFFPPCGTKSTDRIKARMFVNKDGPAKPVCFRFEILIPNKQLIVNEI